MSPAPAAQPSAWAAATPPSPQSLWGAAQPAPQGQWATAPGQPQAASPYGGYGAPGMYGAGQAPKAKSNTGLIIGVLVTVLALLIGVIIYMAATRANKPNVTPTTSVQTASPGSTAIRDLAVGTCFDDAAAEATTYAYAWPIDCTAAHDSEVFFTGSLPDGQYPTDDTVQSFVVDHCNPAFEQYVGIPYGESQFRVFYIFADQNGWDAGNHSLVCYVIDPSGNRTSSVKGVAK